MSTARQRVQAKRRSQLRMRLATRIIATASLLGIPLCLWFIDWPMSLVAALPLAVVGLYLFFYTR